MERIYELLELIIGQLEEMLNVNKEEPELHESYYLTPGYFD